MDGFTITFSLQCVSSFQMQIPAWKGMLFFFNKYTCIGFVPGRKEARNCNWQEIIPCFIVCFRYYFGFTYLDTKKNSPSCNSTFLHSILLQLKFDLKWNPHPTVYPCVDHFFLKTAESRDSYGWLQMQQEKWPKTNLLTASLDLYILQLCLSVSLNPCLEWRRTQTIYLRTWVSENITSTWQVKLQVRDSTQSFPMAKNHPANLKGSE